MNQTIETFRAVRTAVLTALLTCLAVATHAATTLLTFDDIPAIGSTLPVPAGYGGFIWDNFGYFDVPAHYDWENGYTLGMVSPRNVGYNRGGREARITSAAPFDLYSGFLTAAWLDNLRVEVLGFAGSSLVYSNVFVPSATAATQIQFDYLGVDQVKFRSYGGTVHPGYPDAGEMFVLDNLVVSTVPEPSTAALIGLSALMLRRRFLA